MKTIQIKLNVNPIKLEDIQELTFDELFEVLRLKNKRFSAGGMIAIGKLLETRKDFTEVEKQIINGLLPSLNIEVAYLNPESIFKKGLLGFNMSKALLDGNEELREFILENMDKREFEEYVKEKDEKFKVFAIFGDIKYSDIVKIVREESLNPIVQKARKNLKFKHAVDNAKFSYLRTLKADFYLRRYKTINRKFISDEINLVEDVLKGKNKKNHILDLFNIKKKKEVNHFLKLCTQLTNGIIPDYKENYTQLCKIFGLNEYQNWLSNFINSEHRIFIDDIDNFQLSNDEIISDKLSNGRIEISEDKIQSILEKLLDVPFHKKDWGGEINDLYSSTVLVNGVRTPTAFLLKGNGTKVNELQISNCGKNGDQILRLMDSPAQLYIIQYVGNISENVIRDIETKIEKLRLEGKNCWYCIINGRDTYRLIKLHEQKYGK